MTLDGNSILIGGAMGWLVYEYAAPYFKSVLKRVNDAKLEKIGREIMSQKESPATIKVGDRVMILPYKSPGIVLDIIGNTYVVKTCVTHNVRNYFRSELSII